MGAGVGTAIGIGSTALGGILGASGEMQAGQAAANDMNYKAMVALYNSQLAKQKADIASLGGEARAANLGVKARAAIGQERAQQGASGVDPNTGSAAMVQESTRQIGRLEQETARSEAAKEAWGYQVEAANELNQSLADVAGANQARKTGRMAAAKSLFSSASSVGSMFAKYKNPGDLVSSFGY